MRNATHTHPNRRLHRVVGQGARRGARPASARCINENYWRACGDIGDAAKFEVQVERHTVAEFREEAADNCDAGAHVACRKMPRALCICDNYVSVCCRVRC